MLVGYTTGVYDMFHIGHLNLLRAAKNMCDKLIVGVSTDEVVKAKGKRALIPYKDRIAIVQAIKYVDVVIPQLTTDKLEEYEMLKFDMVFVGSDWHKTDRWEHFERELAKHDVKVVYFPYTDGISTTRINQILREELLCKES